MSFKVKIIATACYLGLSAPFAFAADAPPADPLVCSEEEVAAIMSAYDSSLGEVDDYYVPRFEEFREVNMAMQAGNPDEKDEGLCAILADPNFSIPQIDLSALKAAWASLEAMMMVSAGAGVDWNAMMSKAYKLAKEEAQDAIIKGACKLAKSFSKAVNEGINEAYEEAQEKAKEKALETDQAKELGIDNFDEPLWKQVAADTNEKQLGEYAEYAEWYDDDFAEDHQDSMDGLLDKVTGDAVDKNVKGGSESKMDDILDPDYD